MSTIELPNLQPIPHKTEFSDILKQEETFGNGDPKATTIDDRLNNSFDRLMTQSGLDMSPTVLLFLSLLCGITLGGVIFVLQENLLTTAVGFSLGLAIPTLYAMFARSQRQKKVLEQLPYMVDELARAASTGRSIQQCFGMVSKDTPDPLGGELRRCASKLDLGVPMKQALMGLPERTGIVSLNIFSMALATHMQTGGDLVTVMERLARTIRERSLYLGRLRAATAASRATAILMIVLPPIIFLFFMLRDPNYFTNLMASTWGRRITITAVLLDIIGVVWVLRVLQDSRNS